MGFFSKKPSGPVYSQPMPHHAFSSMPSSGMSSPYPMGHAPPQVKQHAAMLMKGVTRDLQGLKRVGVVGPGGGMVERWVEVLGRALEPMTILGGPMKGMQDWMMEVQFLTSKIKERVYARQIPLNPSERHSLMAHTQSWLMSRGGGCDTSQPHVQIVILALGEMARS